LLTGWKSDEPYQYLDLALTLRQHGSMMTATTSFDELLAEFSFLDDWEDKYRTLIELGRSLEPMPDALKTDATKVRGCASQVWLYASRAPDGSLHLAGDSDAHIVRGLVAVLFTLFQHRSPQEIVAIDARTKLTELGLGNALSPTRTNGLYSMVARIQDIAKAVVAE
jgi:cysteine desulfuration protein SufE